MTTSPFAQQTYQVRLEWGAAGLARLAPTDVVVIVDVLPSLSAPADEAGIVSDAAEHVITDATGTAVVLAGGLRNAAAVARTILDLQRARGERTSVAVVAASDEADGGLRFAVEDLLGAGAIVAALGDVGIDHTSPEAAAAGEAFRALRGAMRHLVAASGSGRALSAQGRGDEVSAAAAVDAASDVPVLRGGGTLAD